MSELYLSSAGHPQTNEDLLQHNCLLYSGMPMYASWLNTLGDGNASHVSGNIKSNSELFIIESARMGQGLLLFPEALISEYIKAGELEQVMLNYSSPIDINVVYPFTNKLPKKIRVLIDFISEWLND